MTINTVSLSLAVICSVLLTLWFISHGALMSRVKHVTITWYSRLLFRLYMLFVTSAAIAGAVSQLTQEEAKASRW